MFVTHNPHNDLGSKAAPRPAGIGSAAAGQPGVEGDSMLSKILPGGAAEQAGKLGEGKQNIKNGRYHWSYSILSTSIFTCRFSVHCYLVAVWKEKLCTMFGENNNRIILGFERLHHSFICLCRLSVLLVLYVISCCWQYLNECFFIITAISGFGKKFSSLWWGRVNWRCVLLYNDHVTPVGLGRLWISLYSVCFIVSGCHQKNLKTLKHFAPEKPMKFLFRDFI